MTRTILAAVLTLSFAGAALAEGEGYATTGDWREVKPQTVQMQSQPESGPMTLSGSFEFNDGTVGVG